MNLENYTELKAIKSIILKNNIRFKKETVNIFYENLIPIKLKIRDDLYTIFIDDEYNDLEKNNSFLNFILIFRALIEIDESSDYLNWCKKISIKPNNLELLNYYKNICANIFKIKSIFENGSINYYISDIDFQLNTGVIQLLRSNKFP